VLTAQRILVIAVPWTVLDATASPAKAAVVSFAQVTPALLMQALSGPWLDRVGARRIAALGDLTCATGMLVLVLTHQPPLWLITTVMLVVGIAEGPSAAARTSLLPTATHTARISLHTGAGYAIAVERAATTAGPALAGLAIAAIGGQRTLWLAGLLFCLAALTATRFPATTPGAANGGSYLQQLRAGADFVRTDRPLMALTSMFAVTNAIDMALLVVLLPGWARAGGHPPAVVGFAVSAASATAILTAVTATIFIRALPARMTYLLAAILSGPSRFAVIASGLPAVAVLVGYAVAGLASGVFNTVVTGAQLQRIPAAVRGRALALIGAAAWTGIPAGGLLGALLVDATNLQTALWLCATTYLAAMIYPGYRVPWVKPSPSAPAGPHPAPCSRRESGTGLRHRTHPKDSSDPSSTDGQR
jgi:MFS family permease